MIDKTIQQMNYSKILYPSWILGFTNEKAHGTLQRNVLNYTISYKIYMQKKKGLKTKYI